jgi:hypothetical protein
MLHGHVVYRELIDLLNERAAAQHDDRGRAHEKQPKPFQTCHLSLPPLHGLIPIRTRPPETESRRMIERGVAETRELARKLAADLDSQRPSPPRVKAREVLPLILCTPVSFLYSWIGRFGLAAMAGLVPGLQQVHQSLSAPESTCC